MIRMRNLTPTVTASWPQTRIMEGLSRSSPPFHIASHSHGWAEVAPKDEKRSNFRQTTSQAAQPASLFGHFNGLVYASLGAQLFWQFVSALKTALGEVGLVTGGFR